MKKVLESSTTTKEDSLEYIEESEDPQLDDLLVLDLKLQVRRFFINSITRCLLF